MSAAIRQRVIEVLTGQAGTIKPAALTFAYGTFDGQPDEARQARLLQQSKALHWFDVRIGPRQHHAASPVSTLSSSRLAALQVTIPIWTLLKTQTQEQERKDAQQAIERDSDVAVQALGYPHSLDATIAGASTGIVGGLLSGLNQVGLPEWSGIIEENWQKRFIRSEIRATAVVQIAAAA